MAKVFLFFGMILMAGGSGYGQVAYFIDGYHGGIYGHLPPWQTRFMVDKLRQYPNWKINLEIEPESWDTMARTEQSAYDDFVRLYAANPDRIEYVNPTYGQSYLFTVSGESIIRQFYYGIKKLHEHFPTAVFSTYSSEEPCFTSALPQILLSYGFSFASLKNPNTCWGGYTTAHGGELLNWEGPDGSKVLTVPRYAVEALKPKSTWETIAASNSVAYVTRSFQYGILHPVGMCFQDAGWAYGPWLKPNQWNPDSATDRTNDFRHTYTPDVYETWTGYIRNRSVRKPSETWRFTQEDVLVSLVWGSQILQKIAREVRASENKIIATEKLAAMAALLKDQPWPGVSLDEAWRTLLLSGHHDCWIVPYNVRSGATWADHVVAWTGNTNARCDTIGQRSMSVMTPSLRSPSAGDSSVAAVRVFNTLALSRTESIRVPLPVGWTDATVTDPRGNVAPGQLIPRDGDPGKDLLFTATTPSVGYSTYLLHPSTADGYSGTMVSLQANGLYKMESDRYVLLLDPARGGVLTSWVAKQLNQKELVDPHATQPMGALRGDFYTRGGFKSSADNPAACRILENGPLRARLEIKGMIAGTPFTQIVTLVEGQARIDFHLTIDWAGNTGIGEPPVASYGNPLRKAFYNDSFKLLASFPFAFSAPVLYKDAPFDVLKSKLPDTFFNSWDSIKNDVLLHWADETDSAGQYGVALFCDHTTSYAFGHHVPLGLTIQYSGGGLFGMNYTLVGPTELNFALIPHAGRWDKAALWTESAKWNEPLQGITATTIPDDTPELSLLRLDRADWDLSAMVVSGGDLLVRWFNAEGDDSIRKVYFAGSAGAVREVALNGKVIQDLPIRHSLSGESYVELSMPRFGFRTLQYIHPTYHTK